MQELTFAEKLSILWQNIIAHPIFICFLLLPAVFIFINKKITKKITIIIYLVILALVLFIANTTLFKLFDNMIDGLFMTLYFPNFITLFIVEVLSAIITLITFIKKDVNKTNKIINIISFVLIQALFCLVITVVNSSEIDIYQENALYTSDDVLTLMQLLMGVFALQIISIVVVFAIRKVTDFLDGNKEVPTKPVQFKKAKIITPNLLEPKVEIEKQKPLDKTLIDIESINSIDLKNEINIQERKKAEEIELQKKQEAKKLEEENIKLKKEKLQKEQALKEELTKERKKIDSNIKSLDKTLIDIKPINSIDLKNEINIQERKKEEIELQKQVEKSIEILDVQSKQVEKPTELITNLNIVNFSKTVKVIKNLKRIYTL